MASDEVALTITRTSVTCTRKTGLAGALTGGIGKLGSTCNRSMVRITLSEKAKAELRAQGETLPDERVAYGLCASCLMANGSVLGPLQKLLEPR